MIYRTLHRKVKIEEHKAQSLLFCVVFCRPLFVFSEVYVAQTSLFCVVSCRSLFVFCEVCVAQSLLSVEQHKPHKEQIMIYRTLHRKVKI
jgi:hypothetical protein